MTGFPLPGEQTTANYTPTSNPTLSRYLLFGLGWPYRIVFYTTPILLFARPTTLDSTTLESHEVCLSFSRSRPPRALRSIYAGDTVDEALLSWRLLSSFFQVDNRTNLFSLLRLVFRPVDWLSTNSFLRALREKKVILSGNFVFPRFFLFLLFISFFFISLILVPGQKKKPLLPNWSKPTLLFFNYHLVLVLPARTCTGIAPSLP